MNRMRLGACLAIATFAAGLLADDHLVRLLVLASLALLGMLLVFGVVHDRADIDETDDVRDRATFWRAIGLAL